MRFAVIRFGGSNCDLDTVHVLEDVIGVPTDLVWYRDGLQRAYDAALVYSRERTAFGQPISDFQAIQIKLAEMATKIQAARLLLYWAASEADKLAGES